MNSVYPVHRIWKKPHGTRGKHSVYSARIKRDNLWTVECEKYSGLNLAEGFLYTNTNGQEDGQAHKEVFWVSPKADQCTDSKVFVPKWAEC